MAAEATRIYVGGLGERVTEEDLRKTFSNLGSIEAVDIVRSKGRSFAYINFLPSSDNSLAKLFSMYNGCLWKGGKLKLEKAKEHYIDRLKREWAEAENEELINSAHTNLDDVDENMLASAKPKSNTDTEDMQIRIFFPKLYKMRSLPFRGTGKHKYSFQRLQGPSIPVHFCDCPEHYVPDKTPKETIYQSSTMNRQSDRKTCIGSKRLQRPNGTQVQDSVIQDFGINDEEINVMNSVMKKLLDRETPRIERNDVEDTSQATQQNCPVSDIPVDMNEIDDGTVDEDDDDDDIKINTGSFSESWDDELAKLKEHMSSDLVARNESLKTKEKLSNKKRKSPSESEEKDQASSPMPKKKVHFQTQPIGSEEHKESLKSFTEPETKNSITQNGMWSQKSSWKKLVGDGVNSSFSLSHIIKPRDDPNNEDVLKPANEAPSDNEGQPPISTPSSDSYSEEDEPEPENETSFDNEEQPHITAPSSDSDTEDESNPGNETPSDNEEHEGLNNFIDENLYEDKPKPGNEVPSDKKEHKMLNNVAYENMDDKRVEPIKKEEVRADKSSRGSTWMQKASWTQLVGSGNTSSFSISQILPANTVVEKQELKKTNVFSTTASFSGVATGKGKRTMETALGGSQGSKSDLFASERNSEVNASKGFGVSKPRKISDSERKRSSSKVLLGHVDVSESCPFMRSDDSLKDWMAAKTALSSSLKKRNNNKKQQ